MIEVVEGGLLTTVQDAGRPDWTHLGVPIGGACDPCSLAVANMLVGNEPGAAAIEMTIAGPMLAPRAPIVLGLAGADLGGVVAPGGRRLEPGRSHRLESGWTISFPGSSGTTGGEPPGARAYLSVPGGFDVPTVLGSRSTALAAAFGGLDGRPLRAGDLLGPARPASPAIGPRVWPVLDGDPFRGDPASPIRVLRGPADGIEALVADSWRVAADSDRVGLRLDRSPADANLGTGAGAGAGGDGAGGDGRMASHGVVFGAVQVPADGRPIILLADHQTTGGYPVPAVVASVDRPRLGQLRPGSPVSFVEIGEAEAVAALALQRAALERGAALLREAAGWDALWETAGG
ncbi:MAG TPA: biotin-dependent carboxyltransferase family protein [Candidatus Limnocylindrales bacterium]|nr:biotin-dependent carboxyltransferase family protein [Candidatus Limnocylindrales bacterium]